MTAAMDEAVAIAGAAYHSGGGWVSSDEAMELAIKALLADPTLLLDLLVEAGEMVNPDADPDSPMYRANVERT